MTDLKQTPDALVAPAAKAFDTAMAAADAQLGRRALADAMSNNTATPAALAYALVNAAFVNTFRAGVLVVKDRGVEA